MGVFMGTGAFEIHYAAEAVADVKALRRFDQMKVLDAIETHLRHEPTKVSRSRIKKMALPFPCQYRLRVEEFRAYYDVDLQKQTVNILRVLWKGQGETTEGLGHETD